MVTRVNCPLCGTSVIWSSASPFRPFCSERCKHNDLGAWAEQKYAIPGAAPEEEIDIDTDEPTAH